MAAIDINKIIQTAEQGIVTLAKTSFTTYTKQAVADGNAFLQAAKQDIQKYTQQLADGTIDQETFTDLIGDDSDLAQMIAMKQAGFAQADFDSFINGVIGIIVTAALSAIP